MNENSEILDLDEVSLSSTEVDEQEEPVQKEEFESPKVENKDKLVQKKEKSIKNEKYGGDNEWIDALYDLLLANQRRKNILNNQDLISEEASNWRILRFQFALSFILVISIFCQIVILSLVTENAPNIRILKKNAEEKKNEWHFLHLAIITEDFEVFDFSLNEFESDSKGKLFKLPKSFAYFMYTDESNDLFFVDGTLRKPLVKYHRNKHEAIKLNVDSLCFNHGTDPSTDLTEDFPGCGDLVFTQSLYRGRGNLWLFGIQDLPVTLCVLAECFDFSAMMIKGKSSKNI